MRGPGHRRPLLEARWLLIPARKKARSPSPHPTQAAATTSCAAMGLRPQAAKLLPLPGLWHCAPSRCCSLHQAPSPTGRQACRSPSRPRVRMDRAWWQMVLAGMGHPSGTRYPCWWRVWGIIRPATDDGAGDGCRNPGGWRMWFPTPHRVFHPLPSLLFLDRCKSP
jgi:hypothetical protein